MVCITQNPKKMGYIDFIHGPLDVTLYMSSHIHQHRQRYVFTRTLRNPRFPLPDRSGAAREPCKIAIATGPAHRCLRPATAANEGDGLRRGAAASGAAASAA